jgi:hypothetical protein
MSGKPKYQLVILGANAPLYRRRLISHLRRRLRDIGTGLRDMLIVLDAAHVADRDPISPAVAIWFGNNPVHDVAPLTALVADAVPILPVVGDLDHYIASTPGALHGINAIGLDPAAPNFAQLVNLVLENLGLMRRARRLFLSYRRWESTPAAHQLRVAFDDIGYDTFLDTSSVPKGDEFQAVLWHRLLDSDVVVLLDTPDFLGSQYTQFEIAEASAMSVGILQVLWPGVTRSPYSALATPLRLSNADFAGDQLISMAVARITRAAEKLRARCLAARHTNLVTEFCSEARRAGAAVTVQPERYVLAEIAGRRLAAIPTVGVPDARLYHEASARFPAGGTLAREALLIYDQRGMRPEWKQFLDWLDNFLPVRGLPVTDTAARLGTLR